MKLVKATCPCGFATHKARWGRHCWQWWFPTYDVRTGQLAEEYFQLPEDERRRLWTTCTSEEIAARCREVEAESTDRLRRRYEASASVGLVLFINEHDFSDAQLLCPRCHQNNLRLRQVVVWANCRTDCGHRYRCADSEERGCPICGHRPHSFEIEEEPAAHGSSGCVCWCGCSSHTVCRSHEDGICPKCGNLPSGYEREGIPYCGLHHRRLIPYRMPANFLFIEPVCRGETHRFPHAKIWGESSEGKESVQGGYCESCESARREWMKTHQTS